VAASQQNDASSRAQAIVTTPAGLRRCPSSVCQRWCSQWYAVCDVEDRRVSVLAGASWGDRVGEVLTVVYSRVDADGDLREVRIAEPAKAASAAA
jgi:hypothetical protein